MTPPFPVFHLEFFLVWCHGGGGRPLPPAFPSSRGWPWLSLRTRQATPGRAPSASPSLTGSRPSRTAQATLWRCAPPRSSPRGGVVLLRLHRTPVGDLSGERLGRCGDLLGIKCPSRPAIARHTLIAFPCRSVKWSTLPVSRIRARVSDVHMSRHVRDIPACAVRCTPRGGGGTMPLPAAANGPRQADAGCLVAGPQRDGQRGGGGAAGDVPARHPLQHRHRHRVLHRARQVCRSPKEC